MAATSRADRMLSTFTSTSHPDPLLTQPPTHHSRPHIHHACLHLSSHLVFCSSIQPHAATYPATHPLNP